MATDPRVAPDDSQSPAKKDDPPRVKEIVDDFANGSSLVTSAQSELPRNAILPDSV